MDMPSVPLQDPALKGTLNMGYDYQLVTLGSLVFESAFHEPSPVGA